MVEWTLTYQKVWSLDQTNFGYMTQVQNANNIASFSANT